MAGVADLLLSARILDANDARALRPDQPCPRPREEFAPPQSQAYISDMAKNAPLTMQAVKRTLRELAVPEAERDMARRRCAGWPLFCKRRITRKVSAPFSRSVPRSFGDGRRRTSRRAHAAVRTPRGGEDHESVRQLIGGIAALSIAGGLAVPLAPAALAQATPVTLTVGYQKVGHLAPMILLADALKAQGIELKLVEFCALCRRPHRAPGGVTRCRLRRAG